MFRKYLEPLVEKYEEFAKNYKRGWTVIYGAETAPNKFLVIDFMIGTIREFFEEQDFKKIVPKVEKDDDLAKVYQAEGMKSFKRKSYDAALEKFNKALCMAKSKNLLSLIYNDKSEVYLAVNLLDECLRNTRRAINDDNPTDIKAKLLKREIFVMEKITELEMTPGVNAFPDTKELELTYPANEKFPFIADCIELKKTKMHGKGLYAAQDLHPGDVIIAEDALVYGLRLNELFKRCQYCLFEKHLDLIPCDFCTKAMFCSEDCKTKAWEEFHRFDCEIIDEICSHEFDFIFSLTKVVWMGLTTFSTTEEWIKFSDRQMFKGSTIHNLSIDFTCPKGRYKSLFGHSVNKYKVSYYLPAFNAMYASFLLHRVISATPCFRERFKNEAETNFLWNLLLKVGLIISQHSDDIYERISLRAEENRTPFGAVNIGTGMRTISCLLNHSCAPNLLYTHCRKKRIMYVIKPIKKGEQLLYSYGPHHGQEILEKRKQALEEDFGFICNCVACKKNYPTGYMMKDMISEEEYDRITTQYYLYKEEPELQKVFTFMEDHIDEYPSYELLEIEETVEFQYKLDTREYVGSKKVDKRPKMAVIKKGLAQRL